MIETRVMDSPTSPRLKENTSLVNLWNQTSYQNMQAINNSSSTINIAKHHSSQIYPNFITKSSKKRKRTKRRKVSICLSTPENKKSQINKSNLFFTFLL